MSGWEVRPPVRVLKTGAMPDTAGDRHTYSISEEGTAGPGLSLNGAPGPWAEGVGGDPR